jgi:hypothetical protein
VDQDYLDFAGLAPPQITSWLGTLRQFLVEITSLRPRPIILKSPTHTGRIRWLLEEFPSARFVHIVRNPYTVFLSTLRLWHVMYTAQGLQVPKFAGLEEHVLDSLRRMYDAFERDRDLIPAGRLCELRYEDLTRDPLEQLARVYEELQLGDFAHAAPAIRRYLDERSGYETNRYEMTPEQRAKVAHAWRAFIERYGY